ELTHLYPDGAGLALRDAIAKKHGLTRDHVVLGCGSNEIIEFCYHAFTQPGKGRVLASAYAFAVYGLMARLFGIPFEEVPDRDFHHDLAGFSARLGDRGRGKASAGAPKGELHNPPFSLGRGRARSRIFLEPTRFLSTRGKPSRIIREPHPPAPNSPG
ncbi:MAG: aminotransferase class I/II-fold pyridoxal phosphate-dependent enzyme, partial [Verrucomicrobia bacterium]|nr:aminotransferase class I/II-fold pyridoxal phosphate-dependent enzyme [Verrucomicrobiota bacterium]